MILYAAMDSVPYPKGSGVRIQATVQAYLQAGHRVTLITTSAPDGPTGLHLDGLEHRVVDLPQENFLDRALAFRRIVADLAQQRPFRLAVVRSIWEGLGVMPHLPLIYEAHGFPSTELPYHFPALQRSPSLHTRLITEENQLLRQALLVLTPSHTGARYLYSRGVEPSRIRVLPNSVDADDFRWGEPPPWEPPFRLLYLGTLAPWQGIEVLVEALRHLRGRFALQVQLAGTRKGSWLRRLRHLAQALHVRPCLHLLGPLPRPALREALDQAHLCLAPLPDDPRNSLQGCCPIKILEYMAAGKPILSTRIAPVEELLRHQESAWLVAPNSPKAVADGLAYLLQHPEEAESMGQNARDQVARRFHRHDFQRQIQEIAAPFLS